MEENTDIFDNFLEFDKKNGFEKSNEDSDDKNVRNENIISDSYNENEIDEKLEEEFEESLNKELLREMEEEEEYYEEESGENEENSNENRGNFKNNEVKEKEEINEEEINEEEINEEEISEEEKEVGNEAIKEIYNDDEERNFNNFSEEDLFDPQEESLLMGSDPNDSISLSELSDDDEEDDDIIEENKNDEKVNFNSLTGTKKKYESGRLNKNAMLIAVGSIFLLILLIFNISTEKKKSLEKEKIETKSEVSVGDYSPDFGDYKSRVHKMTQEEKELKKVIDVEENFGNSKNHFIPEESGKVDVSYKDQQEYNKRYSENGMISNSGGYSQGNTSYSQGKPEPDPKVVSDLGYKGEGFGYKTNDEGSGNFNFNNENENPYNLSDEEVRQKYMNTIGNLIPVNNSDKKNEEKSNVRWTDSGKYERNLEGGNFKYINENSIYPGTVIHAVLINGINTDYPGTITARVINNVFDSRTGKNILIPSGSILRGSYSSSSIGVSRVQIGWQELIINRDGKDYLVNLGSMVGIDRNGYSGIKGSLNDHEFQYLKAAGLSCLFTYINSNIYEVTNANKSKTIQEMISESQDIGNKLADKILDRALDIQPTVKVKPGTKISVDVDKILTLNPVKRDLPKTKYIRK